MSWIRETGTEAACCCVVCTWRGAAKEGQGGKGRTGDLYCVYITSGGIKICTRTKVKRQEEKRERRRKSQTLKSSMVMAAA